MKNRFQHFLGYLILIVVAVIPVPLLHAQATTLDKAKAIDACIRDFSRLRGIHLKYKTVIETNVPDTQKDKRVVEAWISDSPAVFGRIFTKRLPVEFLPGERAIAFYEDLFHQDGMHIEVRHFDYIDRPKKTVIRQIKGTTDWRNSQPLSMHYLGLFGLVWNGKVNVDLTKRDVYSEAKVVEQDGEHQLHIDFDDAATFVFFFEKVDEGIRLFDLVINYPDTEEFKLHKQDRWKFRYSSETNELKTWQYVYSQRNNLTYKNTGYIESIQPWQPGNDYALTFEKVFVDEGEEVSVHDHKDEKFIHQNGRFEKKLD